ncbi:MAG: hypoxanthine phosphoribosyltransferase [Calditrichia bacterium]|nr:hypoxanthine phosphoribosyltransferase [Calditrichia bacterium]
MPLFTKEVIHKRTEELGKEISRDYEGKDPIIVGVLNGCYLFIADLSRELSILHEIDFIKISSYGNEMQSSGRINVIKDFSAKLEGRHVIVVEDIVDSGLSVDFLRKKILAMKPASLKFVSLLKKIGTAKIDFEIEYIGFEIEDKFVIGYGLDYQQNYRDLKHIYQMVE